MGSDSADSAAEKLKEPINDELATRLMKAWIEAGRPRKFDYATKRYQVVNVEQGETSFVEIEPLNLASAYGSTSL